MLVYSCAADVRNSGKNKKLLSHDNDIEISIKIYSDGRRIDDMRRGTMYGIALTMHVIYTMPFTSY